MLNLALKIFHDLACYGPPLTTIIFGTRGAQPPALPSPTKATLVTTVASHWQHCNDLTGPVIEPQTSRINSVGLA